MSDERHTIEIRLSLDEAKVERLKQALPNHDHKRSATQAIEEAINFAINQNGAVTLNDRERREIGQRAGQLPPKTSAEVLAAFEMATKLGPNTLHVDLDPGVVQEIKTFALGTQLSFQEQCREIIHEAAVDKLMYSADRRMLLFNPQEWKKLLGVLGVEKIGTAVELLAAVKHKVANGQVVEHKQ